VYSTSPASRRLVDREIMLSRMIGSTPGRRVGKHASSLAYRLERSTAHAGIAAGVEPGQDQDTGLLALATSPNASRVRRGRADRERVPLYGAPSLRGLPATQTAAPGSARSCRPT
jgi:hypothetical protein